MTELPQEVNIELLYDRAVSLLSICLKELKQALKYMYTHVHSSAICSSQKVETTQSPSTDEWINKLWYIYVTEYY